MTALHLVYIKSKKFGFEVFFKYPSLTFISALCLSLCWFYVRGMFVVISYMNIHQTEDLSVMQQFYYTIIHNRTNLELQSIT